jgi:hypothetical protein
MRQTFRDLLIGVGVAQKDVGHRGYSASIAAGP